MKRILLLCCLGIVSCSHMSSKDSGGYKGLGKESVSPGNIQKYAPASLDPKVERKIREMLDISAPSSGILSPDKRQLFFHWKVTGVTQIWKVDREKRFPVQITGGKDSTRITDITPDGRWLIITQDKDGAENPGIYLLSPDGNVRRTVYEDPKIRTFVSFVSKDSNYFVYAANDEKSDSNTFYRYDIASGQREKVFTQPGQWFIADYSTDGRWLVMKAVTNTAREYYEYDLNAKTLTPVLGQGEEEEFEASYAQNEKDFLVSTSKFHDFKRLYLYSDKKWKEVFAVEGADISSFETDAKRQRILVHTNEQASFKVHALDAKTYHRLTMPQFPNAQHIGTGATTWDGEVTTFGVVTSQSPQESYIYNWKTNELKQWVYPGAPGIDLKRFATSKLEYYLTRDGVKIPMFVRRPESCTNKVCPVIVNFHGGPEGQSIPGFSVRAQLFVDAGFIYVEPNVRGSDGYGKSWLHADDREKRLNVITDIEDAALYIRKAWVVNGEAPKIGVSGGSYGGYSALYAMTRFAGSYDAGIAIVGMSNLVTFLQNTAPYRRSLRTPEYGDLEKDREALVKLSPVTYIDQLKAPLMIIQGVNDPRVPVGEALQFQQTLEAKGVPSSLIIFADEGHGAEKKDNQVLEYGHMIEFFKKHLK